MLNHHSRLPRAIAASLVALATLFLSPASARAQDVPTTPTASQPEATAAETPALPKFAGFDVVFLVERDSGMENMLDPAKKLVGSIIESLRKQAKGKPVRVGFMRYPKGATMNVDAFDLTDDPGSIAKTLGSTVFTNAVANDGLLIGLHLQRAVDKYSWSKAPGIERRIYIVDEAILRDGLMDPAHVQRVELVGLTPPPGIPDFRTATRYAVSHGITVNVIHCMTSNQVAYLHDLELAERARMSYDKIRDTGAITVQMAEVWYWSRINWLEVAYLGGGEFYTLLQSGPVQRWSPQEVRYQAEVTMPREVLAAQNEEWNAYLATILRLRNTSNRAPR